jgi:hypothetical protein
MKKILLAVLFLISSNLFPQDWNDNHGEHGKRHKDHHKKNDYFTIGLYTGTYIGKGPVKGMNAFFNSVSSEIEYFKFRDLSLVVRGTYQFSTVTLYDMLGVNEGPDVILNEPYTYKLNISINGRYYLGKRKVKPYLQTGINQETNFINNYTVTYGQGTAATVISYNRSYDYRYSINFGVGFNVKLGSRFAFDMKYDIYKTLGRNSRNFNREGSNGFNGFSVLAGLKYNL